MADHPHSRDPAFGSGAARRRVTLRHADGQTVDAHLIDTVHEMRVRLDHDGEKVTAVAGSSLRYPTTACPGAAAALEELVGLPAAISQRELFAQGRARRHCTHLLDLAALAMKHVGRPQERRVYDALVPDETDAPVWIEGRCDGELVHRWQIRKGRIVAPAELAGLPLGHGFIRWAQERFGGDALETAIVLAKTWFIAHARAIRMDERDGTGIASNTAMAGACFAYSPENMRVALFTNSLVDDPFAPGVAVK